MPQAKTKKKRPRLATKPSTPEMLRMVGVILARMARRPGVPTRRLAAFGKELTLAVAGRSKLSAPRGDRRFKDPEWDESRINRAMVKIYLAASREAMQLVEELELDGRDASSARFLATMLVDGLSPGNNPLTNPVVRKEIRKSRGRSQLRGLQNFIADQLDNSGLISMVDSTPFRVGETVACTPGEVVFRNELIELIQYKPVTEKVYEIPLLIIPAQINRFYVLDMSPDNSLVKFAVAQGFQVFVVSWLNPSPDQRHLGLHDYICAIEEAHNAVMEITGAPAVNFKALCAGGITSCVALARYADQGKLSTVNSLTLNVTLIELADLEKTNLGYFLTAGGLEKAVERSQEEGLVTGEDLAKLFTWLRPNDLVWNYWINNYLMGRKPPAFDVLAWNSDRTGLPAALHADFCGILQNNTLARGIPYELPDATVQLSRVDVDNFIIAGQTDHLTPWEGCYKTVHILGGKSKFVMCNSGHVQTVVCPIGKGKSAYNVGDSLPEEPQDWLASSETIPGSWWEPWREWTIERSGKQKPAPSKLGSKKHAPLCAAPGTYVFS